jgi:hypothetical protein
LTILQLTEGGVIVNWSIVHCPLNSEWSKAASKGNNFTIDTVGGELHPESEGYDLIGFVVEGWAGSNPEITRGES